MTSKKLIVFSENPPLKSKGFGFSVLLYQIMTEERSVFDSLITFCESSEITSEDLREVGVSTFLYNPMPWSKIFTNYKVKYLSSLLYFIVRLPWLFIFLRRKTTFPILVCIGTSSRIVLYTWILSKFLKNPIQIYLVDDIIGINKQINNRLDYYISKKLLPQLLYKAEKIFTISDGLANSFSDSIINKTKTILPVFDKIKFYQSPAKSLLNNQRLKILFSGGINLLYEDALQKFDSFISSYNITHHTQHQLIFQTYSPKYKFDALHLSSFSVYKTSSDREQVTLSLMDTDIFIIPYSFKDENKQLVSTSFPQKMAQLVQYKKPIIFLVPPYSSLGVFCKGHRIDHTCFDTSYTSIEVIFEKVIQDTGSFDRDHLYETYFHPRAAIKHFKENLC